MIVHCKTVEQLEDVIKTEGLILSKTDINTLAWYVGTEKFEVCIDTKNSTWYNSRNAKSTITPYADWKENKMNDQFIQLEGGNTMQITAKLKHKQQLMSLPTFEQEYNDKLWFEDFFVSERMLNKCTLELHWDKQFKSLSDDENYSYNLDWLDTLTFTDNFNRFSFELRIDGLEVTIKPINLYEVTKLSFKDKFDLRVAIHSYCPTAFYDNMLHLSRESATHTFKSHKALTKFIGRLCRVKE